MDYQNYDEYMRSLIGYPDMRAQMSPNMFANQNMFSNPNMQMQTCCDDLERMYPETYRVIYPMVCFACDNIRTPVTEQLVDMMTDDIYDRVEADGRINIDISVEVRNEHSSNEKMTETRQPPRPRRRNRFLRDLIRILLLRELLRRRRPGFPIRPF